MELNPTKEPVETRTKKENPEGGEAYRPDSPEHALYKVVINNLLENTYYETAEESFQKVVTRFRAAKDTDPEFPLQLAAYARQEMYLRDISQLLLVLSANHDDTQPYVQKHASRIINRPDDACTAIYLQLELFGKPVPKPLRKGISRALNQFDAYQLSKYLNTRREVNLYDVFNLVHPVPKEPETAELWNRFMKGHLDHYPGIDPLEPPETWEVILTQTVENALPTDYFEAKEAWKTKNETRLIDRYGPSYRKKSLSDEQKYIDLEETQTNLFGTPYSLTDIQNLKKEAKKKGFQTVLPKMGLFAKIRNLRNMLNLGIDSTTLLTDTDLDYVKKSKIYPFRFYQAYTALKTSDIHDKHIETWLSNAIDLAAHNLPDELGNTFVAVDLSGSMSHPLSTNSDITCKELAALFGAILMKKGATTSVFANDFATITAHHQTPTLELVNKILSTDVGGSTNGWKAIKHLREHNKTPDRIIMLTDMVIWDSTTWNNTNTVKKEFDSYRKTVNPDTQLYMLDLSNYGDLVTPENHPGVYNIQGWSEKVLDYIHYTEHPTHVLQQIKNQ